MQKKLFSSILGAGIVALGLGIPQIADAALHFVPGSKCVVRTGSPAAYNLDAGIANPNSTYEVLMCPGDTLDLATKAQGRVSVVDNTTADQVCCSVRTRNASNGTLTVGSDDCTTISGASSGDQMLTPGDVGPTGITGTFNFHFIQCYVPGTSGGNRSAVNAYRITDI